VPEIELPKLGSGVTFIHAALIKLNRITKAEMMFCRRHFGNAMLAVVFVSIISSYKMAATKQA
jgi:hypothetical protein